jgi:hypothetical protein
MKRSSESCKLPACGANPQQAFASGISAREGRDSEKEKGYTTRTSITYISAHSSCRPTERSNCASIIFSTSCDLPSKRFAPAPYAPASRQHYCSTQSQHCKLEEVAAVYTKAGCEPKPIMRHQGSKKRTPAAIFRERQRGLDRQWKASEP